jgi:uncharacterized OB-fold protein
MADPSSSAEPVSEPPARSALGLSPPDFPPPAPSPPGRSVPGTPPSEPPTGPAPAVAPPSGPPAAAPRPGPAPAAAPRPGSEAAARRLLPGSWRPRPGGRGELLATRCPRCGTLTFPVATVCPVCWNAEGLRTEPVAEPGTVYALAMVRVPEPGIEAPYRIGYADFPGGLRVCGRFTGPDVGIGDPVQVVTAELRQGSLVGWAFRKAGA